MSTGIPLSDYEKLYNELIFLCKEQERSYKDYIAMLANATFSVKDDEGDKMILFANREKDLVEKIINVEKAYRELERPTLLSDPQKKALAREKALIETLRFKALAANVTARNLLGNRMNEIKTELADLSTRLKSIRRGRTAVTPEPLYIDISS